MKKNKCSFIKKVLVGLFCILFLVGSSVPALCAPKKPKKDKKDTPVASEEPATIDVDVYAEGAYTNGDTGDLAVYIYSDINADDLCSYGVKLTYDTDKLENPFAEKNEAVWYMGDGTEDGNKTYMDPDTNTAGEIIFIGGKLDEASPTDGVVGTRVLLGKVTFSRTDTTKYDDPGVNPETYFDIGLEIGRTAPYDNFVTTGGVVKDGSGVSFNHPTYGVPVKIAERGDANASGSINSTDYVAVRNYIGTENPPPYADCNGNGEVNSTDYVCIRNKI